MKITGSPHRLHPHRLPPRPCRPPTPEVAGGWAPHRPLSELEGRVFSDSLGLLSRLGGDYRQAARRLSQLEREGKLVVSSHANGLGCFEAGGHTEELPDDGKIYLGPDLLQRGERVTRGERFRLALQLAGRLYHELQHQGAHQRGTGFDDKRAYTRQLLFLDAFRERETDPRRLREVERQESQLQHTATSCFGVMPVWRGPARI